MITWKFVDERYVPKEVGYLGKFAVVSTYWDGGSSKEADKKLKLVCFLPGIKDTIGHFSSKEEAKKKADFVVLYWIEKAQLKIPKKIVKKTLDS